MYHCPICGGQLETTTDIKTGDSRAVVNICTNPQCWASLSQGRSAWAIIHTHQTVMFEKIRA